MMFTLVRPETNVTVFDGCGDLRIAIHLHGNKNGYHTGELVKLETVISIEQAETLASDILNACREARGDDGPRCHKCGCDDTNVMLGRNSEHDPLVCRNCDPTFGGYREHCNAG